MLRSPRAQRVSQIAFLRLLKRGLAYQLEAPTLWDIDFRTAVAQAELEDRDLPGAYHRIKFAVAAEAASAWIVTRGPGRIASKRQTYGMPVLPARHRSISGKVISMDCTGRRAMVMPYATLRLNAMCRRARPAVA